MEQYCETTEDMEVGGRAFSAIGDAERHRRMPRAEDRSEP
jgi:hypothetical protein